MQTLNRYDFLEADLGHTFADDRRFDRLIAFEHYQQNPARWHEPNEDNPQGDPITAMILEDGPWWVPTEDDE